jgi:hypothetical protein
LTKQIHFFLYQLTKPKQNRNTFGITKTNDCEFIILKKLPFKKYL